MNEPPEKLDEAVVYFWAALSGENETTDTVCHFVDGVRQNNFSGLAIAGYEKEGKKEKGAYLFYCDRDWEVQNDTLHETIDEAIESARTQYTGPPIRWNER